MEAIEQVTATPELHTRDLGGTATTAQVTQAVCAKLGAQRTRCRRLTHKHHTQETSHDNEIDSSPPSCTAGRRRSLFAVRRLGARPDLGPTKPVTPGRSLPAGGTTDVLARALADKLGPALGQTVIVESKPGAGATLGADYVAKAKPDGYTLLVGAVHHTIAT